MAVDVATVRFADSFWDDNDRGVSILTNKVAIATQTSNEIQSLYEIRAQIEEDYGERLLKLSQMMIGEAEDGSFSESVSHVPTAIEITARAHVDLAHQLRQQLQEPLLKFMKDFDEKRNTQTQLIQDTKELRSKHYTNMMKAKDHYTAEYTKMLGMRKYIHERHREMAPTEVHQIEEEIEEQKKLVSAAEKEYKHAVDALNNVTKKWVVDWQNTCDLYQFMEEDRMNFVRSSLWAFANVMSSVYVVDDQCCERIRSALEHTDVQKDLQDFVKKNSTGSDIPAPIPYDDLSNLAGDVVGGSGRGVQQPPPTTTIPPLPTALPDSPSLSTEPKRLPQLPSDAAPPVTRTLSDDTIGRDEPHLYRPLVRTLSDPHAREQTYGSIPMMTIHNDYNRRYSSRDSLTDSSQGFEFVEYGQPANTTPTTMTTPGKPQTDSMSTAFREIETMLDDVSSDNPSPKAPESQPHPPPDLSQPQDPPLQQQQQQPPQSQPIVAGIAMRARTATPPSDKSINPMQRPPMPSPAPIMSVSMSTPLPRKTGVTRIVGPNEPRPVSSALMSSSSSSSHSRSARRTSSSHTTADPDQTRFRPIPNPAIEPTPSGMQQAPSSAAQQQPMLTPGIDEEESEDEFQHGVQPTQRPREEKWMISSLRRPQQLPVMSQNARIYDRQSVCVNDLRIDTTPPVPVPSVSAVAVGHASAIATARSQLQQQPSPTLTEDYLMSPPPGGHGGHRDPTAITTNPGIRSAPWQSIPVAEPRSELYQRGGLQRQGSVNGPRQPRAAAAAATATVSPASEDHLSPLPQQQRASKTPKGKGNRFSRAIFGKKWAGKDEDTIPEVPKMVHQPQQQQQHPDPPAESPDKQGGSGNGVGSRLADGKQIIGYARAIWDYEAKISTELSFRSGDLFAVIRRQPDGWWEAEFTDAARRKRGLIPGNYMESS